MMEVPDLFHYAAGRWTGNGEGGELVSAIDGTTVARLPGPARVGEMLDHARKVGGPALRAMTFQQRGTMLKALASALTERKEELYELSYLTGATRNDSAFDIEGGIGTFYVYASKAKGLPDGRFLAEGARETISKGDFLGQHFLSPLTGVAVHINAYNFPVWGMLEKLAPTLLAGMPAIVKPASDGAWLAAAAFRIMMESGMLPPGSVQLLLGNPGNLLDLLDGQDIVAFTGSAATATRLKASPAILANSVRFSAEQDSLNCSVLGPDVTPDEPEFDLFVREVAREMTQKAGQKCTAIRRMLVPTALMDSVQDALVARLARLRPGDPRHESTRLGALAGIRQRNDVMANMARLRADAELVIGGGPAVLDGALAGGAFFEPTLLRCDKPATARAVHEVEAFGPIATLMPYTDLDEASNLANAGKGALVMSVVSRDQHIAASIINATAPFHGRILVANGNNAEFSTGHGAALPHLHHGGPGRAGGSSELGGTIGMMPYLQRTAVQGSAALLDAIGGL